MRLSLALVSSHGTIARAGGDGQAGRWIREGTATKENLRGQAIAALHPHKGAAELTHPRRRQRRKAAPQPAPPAEAGALARVDVSRQGGLTCSARACADHIDSVARLPQTGIEP